MITRRLFLKYIGAIAAAVVIAPTPALVQRATWSQSAISTCRQPWVKIGEVVGWIGRCGQNKEPFIGGKIVREVRPWNGSFFPVIAGWNYDERSLYADHDLAVFTREVPENFWILGDNWSRYPNVHTYVRMQRYGENVVQAIRALNFHSSEEWVQKYKHVWKVEA